MTLFERERGGIAFRSHNQHQNKSNQFQSKKYPDESGFN